jgi:putative spermidine/putrescine transport system substrate-binding protein
MTRQPYGTGAAAVAAAALLGLSATSALAQDLTVTSWGGSYQDAQREVYFEPFKEATGTNLVEDVWNGGVGAIRAKVEGGGQEWDVVQVEAEELVLGCEEGLYEEIDCASPSSASSSEMAPGTRSMAFRSGSAVIPCCRASSR